MAEASSAAPQVELKSQPSFSKAEPSKFDATDFLGGPPVPQAQRSDPPTLGLAVAQQPVVLLVETEVAVDPGPQREKGGAVETGPASIGGLSVVGRTRAPGFEVMGDRYSVLQKGLAPGETYQAEPGVMMFMSPEVKMRARFGGWRMFSGEGLAKVQFTNKGSTEGYVGLSPNMPMAIVIAHDVTRKGPIDCKRGVFMAGDETITVYPTFLPTLNPLACCCGGMPPIIQSVQGEGTALLAAGGTVVSKQLGPGEKIMCDSESVVAFTHGVQFKVERVGNCLTCCCGGEGCFNTVLEGPGTVYVQSLSYEKLLNMLVKTKNNGNEKGEERLGGAAPDGEEMQR